MSEQRFPLQWPDGWLRTAAPKRAQFVVSLAKARDHLFDELRRMRASDVILSSNAPVNKDGQLRARVGDDVGDNGVAVYFTVAGDRMVIACDRWDLLPDNIRAIGLTVEALRGIERWGSTEMSAAALAGYALPAGGDDTTDAWWTVLEVSPDAWLSEIDAAFKRKAKTAHPDAGGSADAFHQLQTAHKQAREARQP